MTEIIDDDLQQIDPEIYQVLQDELTRQRDGLEMIASENFVPKGVLTCQGSVLTNKYAEGYPGKRYYGGCDVVDRGEQLAIDRAKDVFGAGYANVQPHSGASANEAVLQALIEPGDKILGLDLAAGGHLTHGMKLNFSGRFYESFAYNVNPATGLIDMDYVEKLAKEIKPQVIIAGWSAYPRFEDFEQFRKIADEVGAWLWVDMAHFAGLVAAGIHPSPVPYAHVVSSTAHKTLGGPRSGFILAKNSIVTRPSNVKPRKSDVGDQVDLEKRINTSVFPGQQGGPLEHVIAAKAVCFKIAKTDYFIEKQKRVVEGASIIADRLMQQDLKDAGVGVATGGTDVHLVLVDLRNTPISGKETEKLFANVGITINKNAVPFDPRVPEQTSGIRLGTPALATRGFGAKEFEEVGDICARILLDQGKNDREIANRVQKLCQDFPLYTSL